MQIIFIIVTIFAFAIASILGKYILTEVDTNLDDSGLQTAESDAVFTKFSEAWSTFDYMIVFILVVMTIGLIITGFLIRTHPIFLIVNIVGLFVMLFISAALANLYGELIDPENGVLNTVVDDGRDDFKITTFVMTKLPWICLLITFISSIALYSKARSDGEI